MLPRVGLLSYLISQLGPFATASRRTPPVLHCHLPGVATVAQQHRQQRRRVTEGTAMAPWNGPNQHRLLSYCLNLSNCYMSVLCNLVKYAETSLYTLHSMITETVQCLGNEVQQHLALY